MKKQASIFSAWYPARHLAPAPKAAAGPGRHRLLLLLLLLAMAASQAAAQAIAPNFFGINYWLDPTPALTTDLLKADMQWLRLGGNGFNTDPAHKTAAGYQAGIDAARKLNAEPLMQIPIRLTPAELATFVADSRSRGYNIRYWAIGNEPDPGANAEGWSAGTYTFEGYTYDTWRNQYRLLANKLKDVDPDSKLVGPDFRLFYDTANPANTAGVPSYYKRFLDELGSTYHTNAAGQKRPLLDHFAFHFYGDDPESVVKARFATLQGLIDNVNTFGRASNGTAAPITLALTEVNAFSNPKDPAGTKPWNYKAGQFVAIMAKSVLRYGGLCITPWSIYESSGDHSEYDYSCYNTTGSDGTLPARRSTMWHLAMLSNYRQANVMNSTQNAQADNLVVIGMRGPDGYSVMILNTQATASYTYRASLDGSYHAGPEAVKISLEAFSPLSQELISTILPRTTHVYKLDPSGKILSTLHYSDGDAAPRQQRSFNFVSRSSIAAGTTGSARPLGGSATADITQYIGNPSTLASTRWLLKPAAPGYYFVVNQSTGNAMRPKGATDAERTLENQPISQERLSEASVVNNYFMWSVQYTGNGNYFRLQNRRSGKYLNVKGGGTAPDLPVVQYSDFPNYFSEQWRFDEADAANQPFQARGANVLAAATNTNDALAKALSVYPNPAASILNVSLDAETSEATLTDMTGRVCLRRTLARTGQLNLQGLAKGLYTLTVTTPTGQVRQKIAKE